MSSAFFRAAALRRSAWICPRCASWFTTPLQIPDGGVVSAYAAPPKASMVANIPGTTTAPVMRRVVFDPATALRNVTPGLTDSAGGLSCDLQR